MRPHSRLVAPDLMEDNILDEIPTSDPATAGVQVPTTNKAEVEAGVTGIAPISPPFATKISAGVPLRPGPWLSHAL